ncbi:splicing factor 3a, subunit 1 [Apophysomyces ossiformis]|uniref:Splicing factor 3a, subunit 1 n=1 Tax=Apophysomyces ossiformis TaxID=679940 RepID=A0A8H7BZP4_9FUNG|nr:splicing factor 3a, subunit 1 [Apophysomyces ossiformis]
MTQPIALVTGCTEGGIGYGFCKQLALAGCRVYATARRVENMAGLEDILINNAGMPGVGALMDIDYADAHACIETNVFGTLSMCRAVAAHMIKQNSGKIVNVGSVVGYASTPWTGIYAMSKAAVHSMSDALRLELKPFGISVSVVAPGAIKSNFGKAAEKQVSVPENSYYASVAKYIYYRASMSQGSHSTPTDVFAAEVVRRILRRNPPSYITYGAMSNLFLYLYYIPVFLKDYIFSRKFDTARLLKEILANLWSRNQCDRDMEASRNSRNPVPTKNNPFSYFTSDKMRLRAAITNSAGLYKIAQALRRFSSQCILSFSTEAIRFKKYSDDVSGVQTLIKADAPSLVSNYRVESTQNNEIHMIIELDDLIQAAKMAQGCMNIQIQLRRKDQHPFLDWSMLSKNIVGSTCPVNCETFVTLLSPEQMNRIQEPVVTAPNVNILLPDLMALKQQTLRLQTFSEFMAISANKSGQLKLGIETDMATMELKFTHLDNPKIAGQSTPSEDDDRELFYTVRVKTEDIANFLDGHQLEPENAVCSITDSTQLVFFLYSNMDKFQPQDAPVLNSSLNTPVDGIHWTSEMVDDLCNLLIEAKRKTITVCSNLMAAIDGIVPVETKPVVGIIYPPPDIRKFADKAAEHLAHKGPHLEEHIRENEKHNPKFCFLNPNDPYHAYYQFKLKEAREGKLTPKKQEVKDEQLEQAPEESLKLKEPEAFEFSAPMPAMSAQDLDIMKLTAQFAARNGRQFISQLAQRESRNYQFDFLRPSHSLFPYFTELVKQYTKVLAPPKDFKDKLQKNITNKYRILDRVKERVEWVAWVKAEQKKKEDEDEKEKLAYASIDWHDFIIVETIEFTEADEQADLQPPVSLSELENMSLAQKRMASMPEPVQEEKPGDMEMDIEDVDMEEEEEEEEVPAARPEVQQANVPDTNAPIKIRTDYKPKIFGSSSKANEPTQICPRCGEPIPVSEMDEHMRIELLDPKWKEQKLAMEAKMKDSNLLQEGTDVAKILKNFSGYRSDIFGTEETEIGKKIAEEQEEAKKKERVIWDGHTATINLATQRAAQNMSIEEQIAAIHRSKGFAPDQIGPHIPSAPVPEPSTAYSAQPQQTYYNAPPHTGSPAIPDGSNLFVNQLPGMYNMQHPVPDANNLVRKPEEELDEHPEAKRARFEAAVPAENNQWVAQPQGTISLSVQTPEMPDKPEWNLTGEVVTVTDIYPTALVSTIKDRIAAQLGMPVGKQKLSTATGTVMKNSNNLQFYGLVHGSMIQLSLKDRGKR